MIHKEINYFPWEKGVEMQPHTWKLCSLNGQQQNYAPSNRNSEDIFSTIYRFSFELGENHI